MDAEVPVAVPTRPVVPARSATGSTARALVPAVSTVERPASPVTASPRAATIPQVVSPPGAIADTGQRTVLNRSGAEDPSSLESP